MNSAVVLGPSCVGVAIGEQLSPSVLGAVASERVEQGAVFEPQSQMVQSRPHPVVRCRDVWGLLQHDVGATGVLPRPGRSLSQHRVWKS